MKKLILIAIIILGASFSQAQVGIGTSTPNAASILDVTTTSKGVLLPKYTLTSLTDAVTPVNAPAVGAIIYNTGGTFEKGHYFWNGTNWNKLLVDTEFNQTMYLSFASAASPPNIVPSGNGNNTIGDFTVNSNKIVGASESNGSLTLPTGKYKIEYFIEASKPTSTNSGGVFTSGSFHLHFYGYNAYLANASNVAITQMVSENNVASYSTGSYISVKFTFYYEVTAATQVIRLGLKHDAVSSSTAATEVNLGRNSHFIVTKLNDQI